MAFMLGSFTDGLFSSTKSLMTMYGMYQGIQQAQMGLDAASSVKDAMNEQSSNTALLERQKQNEVETDRLNGFDKPDADHPDYAKPLDLGKLAGATPGAAVSPALATSPRASSDSAADRLSMANTTMKALDTGRRIGGGGFNSRPGDGGFPDDIPTSAPPASRATAQNPNPQLPVWKGMPQAPPNSAVQTDIAGVTRPPGATATPGTMPTYDVPPQASQYAQPPAPQTPPPAPQTPPASPPASPPAGQPQTNQTAAPASPQPDAAPPPAPQPQASQPAVPVGPQSDAAPPASLGGRIMSALSPIGSAQAAPAQAAPAQAAPAQAAIAPAATTPAAQPPAQGVSTAPPAPAAAATTPAAQTPTPATASPASHTPPTVAAAGPVPVAPGPGAKVAPGQTAPSVQSETSPTVARPRFDTRPYQALEAQRPQMKAIVDKVAAEIGVTPQRLALHGYLEGGLQETWRTGADGEIGTFQVLPKTIRGLDPKGTIDPTTFEGSARLAAMKIHQDDTLFGQDTPSSVLSYQQGAGNADRFATNFMEMSATSTNGMKYLSRAYGEHVAAGFNQASFSKLGTVSAQGVLHASDGGPDGVLNYLSETGPAGLQMTDKMRQAETALVTLAASRGDIVGMQHARDFILQISQQGAAGYLLQAHQSLMTGDGAGAAQALARAHAFVPDGSIGRFGVDGKGQVWGQRFDEHDPSKAIGARFQVTPDSLTPLMIMTKDPATYLKMVTEQQKVVAQTRYQDAHAKYMTGALDVQREGHMLSAGARIDAADAAAQSREAAAKTRAQAQVDTANIRAQTTHETNTRQVDKEAETYFGAGADLPAMTPEVRGRAAQVYTALRANAHVGGISPPNASAIAQGLSTGTYHADVQKGVVVDAKNPADVKAYLTPAMVEQLMRVPGFAPVSGTPRSPVGAGAGTTAAIQQGVPTGSLSPGSSAAIPTRPQ